MYRRPPRSLLTAPRFPYTTRFRSPREGIEAALDAAGVPAGTAADYDRLRLSLGVPDGSRDMPAEKALLLESNFDALHGIGWEKGCYIGQELTARTQYRGQLQRRLMTVVRKSVG